uniref:RRM domain-containing protein n=1 Tax=Oryzias latipes TaxID=8090 RepID=A0A3B3HCA7_ORYLA
MDWIYLRFSRHPKRLHCVHYSFTPHSYLVMRRGCHFAPSAPLTITGIIHTHPHTSGATLEARRVKCLPGPGMMENQNGYGSFGFVTYSTPEETNAAMAAAPHTVQRNSVKVKGAVPKAKANGSAAPAKGEKIFVGGLKNNIEEYHLTDYFSRYGPVEKSEILLEKETGKKRGFGFVHFTHHKTADLALVEKYHTVNGHLVEIKKAVAKQEMQTKIFVGGLKNNIEEFHLTNYFSRYGQVEKSEILLEKETGKKRGFGFVHFTHHKTADLALVEKYHTVNGHLVEVKKAVAKQEMQAGNRTETTPRHRPGQCMMENQTGYGVLVFCTASSGPQHHRNLQ